MSRPQAIDSPTADPGADDNHDPALDPALEAVSAVQLGIWISATRCLLTYVVAPAAGAIGIFLGPLGLLLQVLGAITASYGARSLWALGHRLRHVYALVALAVTAAALVALTQTLKELIR